MLACCSVWEAGSTRHRTTCTTIIIIIIIIIIILIIAITVITFMMRFVCAILQWISAADTRPVRLRQLGGKSVFSVLLNTSYIFLCPYHIISDLNPRRQLVRSLQSALLATATVVRPCRVRVAHTGLVLFSVL